MDEVEVERKPGSTTTEVVGVVDVGGPLQGSSEDAEEKAGTSALLLLQHDDDDGGGGGGGGSVDGVISTDDGGREEEAARFVLQQGMVVDDLEPEGAGPNKAMLGGVDGTALEAPASDLSVGSIDDPREVLRASLTREEDGDGVPSDAHEQAPLSLLEPVGHLEREVDSPETSATETNQTTANIGMAASTRSVSEVGGVVMNEPQTGVSELSATVTDIQEEPSRSKATSHSVGSSEAMVETKVAGSSEGSSGNDCDKTSTSSPEGVVPAAPAENPSSRGSAIVTASESGSEGAEVCGVGASDGEVELVQAMAADEDLTAEGTRDALNTSRPHSTQESAAENAASQTSTGGFVLQRKPGSKNSMAVPPSEGADVVDCILDDPTQASKNTLIEAVVAKYLSFAAGEAVAAAVAAPEVYDAAPTQHEVPENRLEPHASSSVLEESKQDEASCSTENVVEAPESSSMPVSGGTPNATEAGAARGDGSSASIVCAVVPQFSVENIVVRDYINQTLPTTAKAEIAAMATLRDRDLTPESVAVICLDGVTNPVSGRGVSVKDDETGGSELVPTEALEAKAISPNPAKDRDGDGIEEGPPEGTKGCSTPGSQIFVKAQTLVDEVIASSLVRVKAIAAARARDATYGCASSATANRVEDPIASLCNSSLEDKYPTDGAQTPRTVHSESTSLASVSSQDHSSRIEGELSPSTPHAAEPLQPRDLADGGGFIDHEAPQVGTGLESKNGESTPEYVSGPRVGAADNESKEPSSPLGDLSAAEFSAPETVLQSSPPASASIDDDDCVTNTDKGQIENGCSVPIPDSPVSAETRAVADNLGHVATEEVTTVGCTQRVGETSNDIGGPLPITAQVMAGVAEGEQIPPDAVVAPTAGALNDQQMVSDSSNAILLSSDYSQASAAAGSLVGPSGAVAAEAGGATVLDPATRSVPSEPSTSVDETVAGVSGADFTQEQREVSSAQPLTEPAACPAAAAPGPDGDRVADPPTPATIESAADLDPLPMRPKEVPADPALISPPIDHSSCSGTLLPTSPEGRGLYSPEKSSKGTVHSSSTSAEEAWVGRHASGSPYSHASLRGRVVADYLSDKLHDMVLAETASQVSENTGESCLHRGPRYSGGAKGNQSGVDQNIPGEESGDSDRLSPSRAAQGTQEDAVVGSINPESEVLPNAGDSAAPAQGQPTTPPTETASCAPSANEIETEDGPRLSPAEEHAPTRSSMTLSSIQDPNCSSSDRRDDNATDVEIRSSLNLTTPVGVENTPTEARASSGASENPYPSPPASRRYKVMTGCLSDEVSEVVEADVVASSRSSRACGVEPAMGVRNEARVGSDANDNIPSSAPARCEVVTGCLSDEVRGVVAADAVVSSRSSTGCGIDSATGVQSEARGVGSDPNDKKSSSASPRYRVVTGCLSDEIRGVVAADMAVSSRPSSACGLDTVIGVRSEAQTAEQVSANERDVDNNRQRKSAEERDESGMEQDQAEESGNAVLSLASPTPIGATLQQDLGGSIHPEVELGPEPRPKSVEDSSPRSPTETLDHDSGSSRHLDDPSGVDIHQRENLGEAAAQGEKTEHRIDQGSRASRPSSSVSLLQHAVVAHYLANTFRDTVVAYITSSASSSVTASLGLIADAQTDRIIPSAPPGCVPGTLPAAVETAANESEIDASGDDGDAGLAANPPLAQPAEVEQVPADQIKTGLPDGQRDCCEEQAESGADGDGVKEGNTDAQQAETPTPPIAMEETPLRNAEPESDCEPNHPPVNFEPLASTAGALSGPQEAEAQTEALEPGAAEARANAAAWLAGVGGRAKSVQAKASEDRAEAVAWLHNIGRQETCGQDARSDASSWLRETGEREVSLQERAEAARGDALEWLTTKGATELQRTKSIERPGEASQQQLDGDGVDQRTRTEATPTDMDTTEPKAEPPWQSSEESTPGDRERGSTAPPEEQPSEPSAAIDVAQESAQAICSEDMVHPETNKNVTPLCPVEVHRIEDNPVATINSLPCRTATSGVGDAEVEPPADLSSLKYRSDPPLCPEAAATARLPHKDVAVPTEPVPQESSHMLTVGENDWARVSLCRTPNFDALNSPSIALSWEPAGGKTRSFPPDVGGFGSTASSATIADKVPVAGSAMASTAAAPGVNGGCAVAPSNNGGGSEWVDFFAPPYRMAPTGDAYGGESVCSAEASASTTARRISTGSTLPSYGSGETGGGRIPRRDGDDRSRVINENGGHLEGEGTGYGAQGTETWTPPPADPRSKGDCKRWSKAAERSRRYTRRWKSFLSRVHRHFDSEAQVRKRISVVRRAHPDVSNEVAFVALAQSHGRASEAAAVLHLSRAKEEAALVTMMLDVASFISLAREAAEARRRRRSRHLEENQPSITVSNPQSKGVLQQAHDQGREAKEHQRQQERQHNRLAHHMQQRERRRERAVQQRQRDESFLSSESVECGGFNGRNANANVDTSGRGVTPENSGETADRGRQGRLRGRSLPTGIDQGHRRTLWSQGSESSPTLLPPIVRLADGTPPTPNTLKTVLSTSTSVAPEIPEGFGLATEFGGSMKRASDQGHTIKSTKRAQRAILRARARFQRKRMAEIAAPAAHHNGSGLDAVTERFFLETRTLDRDSRDLDNRLRAQKMRDPGLGWGRGKVYGNRSVDGSGLVWGQSSSAFLASLDTAAVRAPCGNEAVGASRKNSPSAASAVTAVDGCGDRGSCRVQNYFTQALTDDGICGGQRRGGGGGGDGWAVAHGVRAPRK